MNKDKGKDKDKGAMTDKTGKTQQKAGKAAGSSGRKNTDVAKQSEARMQKAFDDMKAAFKNSRHS